MTRFGSIGRPLAGLLASISVTACAAHAFVRPAGPGVSAPDAARVWDEARAGCRAAPGYTASLGLTGQLGDRRIRGLASARIEVAVTKAGQMALEARVSGELLFKLAGTGDRAVLLLAADRRVVTAPAGDIVDALIGVPLNPDRLLAMMTGCLSISNALTTAARYRDVVEVTTPDATAYLQLRDGGWSVRAGEFGDFTVDYRSLSGGVPREIGLRSRAGRAPVVTLSLSATSVDLAGATPVSAFSVNVPEDATAMSIDELRRSGPLGTEAGR